MKKENSKYNFEIFNDEEVEELKRLTETFIEKLDALGRSGNPKNKRLQALAFHFACVHLSVVVGGLLGLREEELVEEVKKEYEAFLVMKKIVKGEKSEIK